MKRVSRLMFAIATALLALLAALLIGYAAFQVIKAIVTADKVLSEGDFGYIVIDAVGYVVIAIAILDVTKHFVEQEILGPDNRAKGPAFRNGFYEFVSIISIAVFLEGLHELLFVIDPAAFGLGADVRSALCSLDAAFIR